MAPRILLTNDDGIDAPGLAALYEELTAVGEVVVVAPTENQSGVGRTRSHRTPRDSHPWGWTIEGTPADCVAYGLRGLDGAVDLVVSGCNHGPNAGNYVVGRSGTVGACIEAAFLETPSIAVSAYHGEDFFTAPAEEYDFGRPARIAREVVVRARSAEVFEAVDILNVNAPVDVVNPRMRVTEPHHDYDIEVQHEPAEDGALDSKVAGDGDIALRDVVWPGVVGWENPFDVETDHRERYGVGTDRRALVDGEVSVSPLSAPLAATDVTGLDTVVDGFNESATARAEAREGADAAGGGGN